MGKFDVKLATQECIDWIKKYFVNNGPDSKAVIGISGGKDSSVAAALCVKALGVNRVIGVLMPQGKQEDIQDAYDLVQYLNIDYLKINIGPACETLQNVLTDNFHSDPNNQVTTNLPARIRMTTLYGVAAQVGGRVVNTCNLSEDFVGYSTKFGDSAGDFAPLANLTSDEVIEIGHYLLMPDKLLTKTPADGLSGLTDEQNLGFSYAVLNDFIKHGVTPDYDTYKNIMQRHDRNLHKLRIMPKYSPSCRASICEHSGTNPWEF